jgi:hypothetical protein
VSDATGPPADKLAPSSRMLAPRLASDVSTGRRFRIRWSGSDFGSGVASFQVQRRRTSGPRPPRAWKTIQGLGRTTSTSARVSGRAGQTYAFRVRARDRAGNVGRFSRGSTIVPTGERPRGAHYRGPWRVRRVRGAFGGRVVTCARARRCRLTLRYTGRSATIVGLVGPRGGRALVKIDGRSRRIDFYRRKKAARRVVFSAARKRGRHTLKLVVLGSKSRRSKGHAVTIDGFGLRDRAR